MSKPLVFGLNYTTEQKDEFLTEAFDHPFSNVKKLYGYADTVVLTKKELEQRDRKMIADAWEACKLWNLKETLNQITGEKHNAPDFQEYIDSVLKNNQT